MRIVIVGGAGFIGRAVATRLAAEDHAVMIADTAQRLHPLRGQASVWSLAEFDFTSLAPSPGLLDGADALIHLGCTTHPSHSMAAMAYDAASNIAPSVALFEAARDAGVETVVFSSSGGTVYGAPAVLPVDEDAPVRPLSAYGVSKLAIERYLALVAGVRGISLRVGNPYGADQLRGAAVGVIARYVATLARGEAVEVWGDGSAVRDYIAVEDVARAFAFAVTERRLSPGPYNIGSGVGASLMEVLAMLARASGRAVATEYRPARGFDVPAIVLDCDRFKAATGWSAGISLDAGISALWHAAVEPQDATGEPGGPNQ